MIIWFVFGFMCALVVILAGAYFKFVSLNNAAKLAWLRLDNKLKNRLEVVPSLTLSAALLPGEHRCLIEQLHTLKNGYPPATDTLQRSTYEEGITRCLRELFAAAAQYQQVKNEEHFIKAQKTLLHAESQAQSAKRRYNSAARDFNTLSAVIPLNFLANMFEFKPYDYFDLENSLDKVL